MNIIEMIAIGLILLLVVLTFVAEPKLSLQYFKAFGKSVGIIVIKVKNIISSFIDKEENKENG